MPIVLSLTDAGEAAVQAASGADQIVIAELALSDTPFTVAPTLTALPGEFKRLDALAGEAVAPNITTMSAYDTSADVWDATGFGLFLDDGTLFATYSSPDPVLSKASLAFALISFDVAWSADLAANISFGNPIFTSPPATTEVRGIVELATNAEADAGTDTQRALTPAAAKQAVLEWLLTQDGSGSGLDADLLDGQNGSYYADIAARLGYTPLRAFTGLIVMWSGSVASIPAGWHLCDGTEGTPDLRGRFIVGAGGDYEPAATGGAADHNHGGNTGGHVLTAAQMPAHAHDLFANATSSSDITGGGAHAAWSTANAAGNQDYDIAGTATAPTLALSSQEGGDEAHDHSIGNASNLPPYFALAFIMKL